MKAYEATVVVPINFVLFTISAILSGKFFVKMFDISKYDVIYIIKLTFKIW